MRILVPCADPAQHHKAYLASHKEVIDAEPISQQRAIIDRQGISKILVDVERRLPQVRMTSGESVLFQSADPSVAGTPGAYTIPALCHPRTRDC